MSESSRSKIAGWLLVALALVCAPHAFAQSPAAARQLVLRGNALMGQNKVDAAIENYNRAIALSPAYAEAYVRRGMARRAKGDLSGSIEDYEKAASIDPKSTQNNRYVAESYSNRGYNRLNKLDVDGAIADFNRAISVFPGDADNYYKRGRARLIAEDFGEAVADFDKALTLTAAGNTFLKALIYADRGMAEHLQGKEAEARKDFDECVRLNKGEKLMLDRHLMDIQMQMMILKRLREERQKGIT
jgi:tetratricopeptide (TPR) repeat protein